MKNLWLLGGLTMFPALCTALGAAAVFFLRKNPTAHAQRAMLGFAAGVMLAASVWSLLLPSIDYAAQGALPVWAAPTVGFCVGAFGLMVVERATEKMRRATCEGKRESEGKGECECECESAAAHGEAQQTAPVCAPVCAESAAPHAPANEDGTAVNARRVALAVTLHNLPEGMIVGLAAAVAISTGDAVALSGAIALSLGIGLQNIPEGASVSLPMRQSGEGRLRSFLGGAASGIIEPIGAFVAVGLAALVSPAMAWLLAAAAGAMVCVAVEEMIPIAMAKGRIGVISVVLGFALMMALDVGLA